MPRRDDDFDEDDDLPRRRSRSRDDDDFDDAPARRPPRRRVDEDVPARPRKKSHLGLILGILAGVFLICCGGGGIGAWLFWDRIGSVAGANIENRNNLAQIGVAFHNAHDMKGSFPNDTYDMQGKPLLSWRVHLLPQLGEGNLFNQFNLNEPWDGPTNKPLIARMPRVYGTPANNSAAGAGRTYYRGFSHAGAIFEKPFAPGNPMRIHMAGIVDGVSNTILVVEAGESVEWTKPDQLVWQVGSARPSMGGPKTTADYFWALMCDGSVVQVRKNISDQTLRSLISRNDGNVINEVWPR